MGKQYWSSTLLKRLKTELRTGNITGMMTVLREITSKDDLIVIKAHKLLLITTDDEELYRTYLDAASKILNDPAALKQEEYYLSFLRVYVSAISTYERQLSEMLADYLKLPLKDFLFHLMRPIGDHLDYIQANFYQNLAEQHQKISGQEAQTELAEAAHHQLKGALIDTLFAVTRLINYYGENRVMPPAEVSKHDHTDRDGEIMYAAMHIGAFMNSYFFALDKLSYNEWYIESREITENKPSFKFSNVDFLLEKARDLGVRRMVVSSILGRTEQRWLATRLEPFALEALTLAWDYYQDKLGIFVSGNQKFSEAKKLVSKQLDELDAEDELLFGFNVGDQEVISHYFTIIAITVFVTAAKLLSGRSTTTYYLTCPELPEKIIEDLLSRTRFGNHEIKSKLADYVITLPVNPHLELIKRPFLQDQNLKIYALDYLSSENWAPRVRSVLMQGGKIADQIGKAWEGYVAKTLQDHGWDKVLTNIRIKKNKQIVTDVDIIAKRKDLLLLIQLKITYANDVHNYDQWKSRRKLMDGVEQVKKSEASIQADKHILAQHFSPADLKEISTIQSMVMTNSHVFNGWIYQGVPIMSTSALMQLLNGAQVKFTSEHGVVMSTKNYASSTQLSTAEFLDFIQTPLDWRIGAPAYHIKYHTEKFDQAILHFPLVETTDIDFFNRGS